MFIVGELINASRKRIAPAIENKDVEAIQNIARKQHEAGADYIDVNAGIFEEKESEYLEWLVRTVQDAVDAPCCIDTPNPQAFEAALAVHRGVPMLNSISLEEGRFDAMVPFLTGGDSKVIGLCMGKSAMPSSSEERIAAADQLINRLAQANVAVENVFIDALAQPVSTDGRFGMDFLDAVERIMKDFDGVHTICGISNVSFGLPNRKLLNQAFIVMAIAKGLDTAIVNPLDKQLMANIVAAETLAGRDDFCERYLDAHRGGQLEA